MMMRSALAFLLAGSVVTAAAGGMVATMHGSSHSHIGCVAAIISDQACPASGALIEFLAYHLEAWQGLTLALVLITGVRLMAGTRRVQLALASSGRRRWLHSALVFPRQYEFIRWQALHENSPNWT